MTCRQHYVLFIGLLVACFYWSPALCQTNNNIPDSLRKALQTVQKDTDKVNILLRLVDAIPCENATAKLNYANMAKQLAEKNGWGREVIVANRSLGSIYDYCLNDQKNAILYYEENVALCKDAADTVGEAVAMEEIAKCYEKHEQHQKAFEYFGEILSLKPGGDIEMGVLGDMGVIYSGIGDYSNALSCYIRSLTLLQARKGKEVEDTTQKAGLLLNIGDIYLQMSRPEQAFDNYDNVLKISGQVKDDNLAIWSYIGLGRVYKAEKKYDQAIENFQAGLDKCSVINDLQDEARIMNELADTYLQTGITDKATTYAMQALGVATEKNYTDAVPVSYSILGDVCLRQKKYPDAVLYMHKALDIYQQKGALDYEKNSWQALSSAYSEMGEPAKALDAFKHYISIRDSVYNIAKANELIRMDLQFDFKRRQLADSLKQAGYYGKKIERQRILTYSSYTGLVLVILLSFFIYRSYTIQKKYNVLLSKEKKRHLAHIEEQNNVLKDIAHIQSHDVRGPVATILGLTQFYNFDDPTDPINKEIVEGICTMTEELDIMIKQVITIENKLRRKSMEDLP